MENKYYEKLKKYQADYPELTYDNKGYSYLSLKVREDCKVQIEEISEILREVIEGFVEFNNFKPREDGTFCVRCQYQWDETFTGVGYFNIELFKDVKNDG